MVHVPAATSVTVLPLTAHTARVSDEKLTGSPDDAVALTVNGGAPNVLAFSAPKLIVWLSDELVTAKL